MLVARVLELASKFATHRMLHDDTATTLLGRVLSVSQCGVDDQYRALGCRDAGASAAGAACVREEDPGHAAQGH